MNVYLGQGDPHTLTIAELPSCSHTPSVLGKEMNVRQPVIRDPYLRRVIIDLLRQQEGLKKKLQALLD
jgi:hypothetical protein